MTALHWLFLLVAVVEGSRLVIQSAALCVYVSAGSWRTVSWHAGSQRLPRHWHTIWNSAPRIAKCFGTVCDLYFVTKRCLLITCTPRLRAWIYHLSRPVLVGCTSWCHQWLVCVSQQKSHPITWMIIHHLNHWASFQVATSWPWNSMTAQFRTVSSLTTFC